MRRLAALLAVLAAPLLLGGGPARADQYPMKPVRMIVPFPPGGPTDIVARLIAKEMVKGLGQPIVVENIPGAGGNIGASAAARAAPDGYTMLLATLQNVGINPHLFKLDFDPAVDLAPVSMVVKNPNVLLANPGLPANDLRELIAYAKANPDAVAFASSGNGSSTHLSGELMNRMAGLKMIHVPYKGSAPALIDLMGGQVQISFDNVVSAYPHIKAGKVKPIAVTIRERVSSLPDVPTMHESGLPGFETAGWSAVMVPARTPAAVIDRLNAEVRRVLELPEIRDRLVSDGAYPAPSSPQEFAEILRQETRRWGEVIRDAGIKLQ